MGKINREGNIIEVVDELGFQETTVLIASMHAATKERGFTDFTLDFSKCTFASALTMMPVVARAQSYWKDGVDITLKLPSEKDLQGIFLNTNWAHWIDVRGYQESEYRGHDQIPGIKFQDAQGQPTAVNRIIEFMLATATGSKREDLRAIEWALNEVTDNVLNHAQSSVGGFVQVTNFPRKKRLEFAVVDVGIGMT